MKKHIEEIAYERGYRVTEDGVVLSPTGKILKLCKAPSAYYPRMTIVLGPRKDFPKNKHCTSIAVHRLAAYCFYGDKLFEKGIQVRHLSDDVMDVSKKNIVLGTKSQNEMDKPKEIRKEQLLKRNSARMRIFTDEQVLDIIKFLDEGKSVIQIASEYEVNRSTIYKIKNRDGIYSEYE